MNRQTDRVIPIYPPKFVCRGYKTLFAGGIETLLGGGGGVIIRLTLSGV